MNLYLYPVKKNVVTILFVFFGFIRAASQMNLPDSTAAASLNIADSIPHTPFSFFSLPQNFYTSQLKGACAAEWKLEKATGIALRLRLGSLEYCNRLEGKP